MTTSGTGIKDASAVKMRLEEEIVSLISEVQDFNPSTIDRIELPTPLEFHRYVAANRPVIISLPPSATTIHTDSSRVAATEEEKQWSWPAFTKWTNEYLTKTLGEKEITVACTPDGWADAVVDDTYFAMPCEKKMTFSQFLDGMPIRTQQKRTHEYSEVSALQTTDATTEQRRDPYQEVRYIQLQNGNLMTEYEELLGDVPAHIPFASEALGKSPDAVNFWYGDERSTTSLHKDHYENIYAVVAGRKIFTLIPPTEQFCLHEKQYIAATYVDTTNVATQPPSESGTLEQALQDNLTLQGPSSQSAPISIPTSSPHYILEPLDPLTMTKWIALNPSHEPKEELFEKYPRFQMCQPFRVELNPGEMLYLPAMWYHQVEQEPDHEGKCIAVNWWYDMGFEGDRFSNATFMNNLVQLVDQI
ncbi:peptidyl-lysine (3S)-dioxygenase / protease [Entomortierella parvispora]|uniref:Peptidyl-lysine (3S)-dioxygenase / protease n=1 Tax=Entomortierella parvispora TaxID=205924 RepID=A0A9P3H367_9FUNG|nr:peptidyl-lysine (3S)-dioxygenase / protease [Entomortierella parvispora]